MKAVLRNLKDSDAMAISKVYLAHSKNDYGSEYIREIKEAFQTGFTSDITKPVFLDPSEVKVSESEAGSVNFHLVMSKYFYPMINNCDIFAAVVDSKTKQFSSGVLKEIEYAKSCQKFIIEL